MEFILQPFPSPELLPNIQISGEIQRDRTHLNLSYQVTGNLQQILIPPPVAAPTRQDELWKTTCWEFFLGVPNDRNYWEFNLSPSGHWNVYHFEEYRQGMQNESAFAELPFQIKRETDRVALSVEVNLAAIQLDERNLEVAVTAVIQHRDETVSYWALTHQGKQPDFHRRESFILQL